VYENSSSFRDFTDIERIFVSPVLTWKIGDRTNLYLEIEYLNDERPFDRGLVAIGESVADIPIERRLGEPGDVRQVEDFSIGYRLEHQLSERWILNNSFRALFSDNYTQRFEPRSLDEETGILEREFRITEGTRSSYVFRTESASEFTTGSVQHNLLLGVDWTRVLFDERGFRERPTVPINIFEPEYGAPIPDAELSFDTEIRTNSLGFYAQDLMSLGDNWKLLMGARWDSVNQTNQDTVAETDTEQDDSAFSPNLGMVYQPNDELSLYASFSQSFQPNTATAADGSFLEPEQSTQYEVGIKGNFLEGRLTSNLAFYHLTKTNVGVTDPDNPDFLIPVGEQRSEGVEFDIAGEILPGWKIIANYAYTDALITQGDEFTPSGNQFPNVPRNSASLWTTYELQSGDLKGFGVGIGSFFVDERSGDIENTFRLSSYLRTDALFYYRSNNLQASLNIHNLFDVRYFESSGFDRERITPGAPFTVLGALRIEF
jgi:iron complex outermembrane receptor protein